MRDLGFCGKYTKITEIQAEQTLIEEFHSDAATDLSEEAQYLKAIHVAHCGDITLETLNLLKSHELTISLIFKCLCSAVYLLHPCGDRF